ncbi:MAG: alanine:cation symporter family protein [Coriobacteriales bacterium]|nr:alanine:cation symporter family protein [Coriobacteriales bacterium]
MMDVLEWLDGILYYPILIVILIGAGLYFGFRTKFVQIRMFAESCRVLAEKPHEEGGLSSFKALMISTASRVGTGNIVGVSTAICLGGFGAVFWMWVIALVGMASAFVESTLAQIYKKKDKDGSSYGGPSYYIQDALHSRTFAVLFAIALILTYAGGFNMLASYNLQSAFEAFSFYNPNVTPWIIGAIVSLVVFWVIAGGGKRIGEVAGILVPFMGGLYVLVSLVIIILHAGVLPAVIGQIITDAFDFHAIFGGVAGSCLTYGIKRGLYSNEAGVGSAPNAAAAASVSHPVKQGLVQMFSVFLDTIIICSATAFMCMCCGADVVPTLAGAPMVQTAVGTLMGKTAGAAFIAFAMSLFAFTTLIGNLYYCNNCLAFLNGGKPLSKEQMGAFYFISALLVFVGAGLSMAAAWDIADILMALMCFINIPACCILGKRAYAALEDYIKQRKAGLNPEFHAADIGMDPDTLDFWK